MLNILLDEKEALYVEIALTNKQREDRQGRKRRRLRLFEVTADSWTDDKLQTATIMKWNKNYWL